MKIHNFVLIFCLLLTLCDTMSAQNNVYKYKINLNEVSEDRLKVELKVPAGIQADQVFFHFPRIVPGTYALHDYGQLVRELKAFDAKGNSLYVDRVDESSWRISKAKKLDRIVYIVDDTWDTRLKDPVFESAGTSFEEGKSFLLNTHGLFGFFKNGLDLPIELTVAHPSSMYGATSLRRTGSDSGTDYFTATNYRDLIDRPMMYTVPDTVNFKLGYGEIQIAVYSPNNKVRATEIKERIMPILEAQNKYLGSILPVDHYNFLIYLSPKGFPSGNESALEHHNSALFCFDEDSISILGSKMVELSAHEFFHIVTPLHVKSEEIQYFDYLEPKMSRHLWLYEGVVEYMSFHMQVKTGLMSASQLLNVFSQKQDESRFGVKEGLSLAEISSYILIEPYSNYFETFYTKAALAAMCLDLSLINHSKGKYDLQSLLKDLSSHFGKEQCFKDDELYEKIIEITRQKDLLLFFSRHIEGTESLKFNEYLEPFGLKYSESALVAEISPLGGLEKGVLRSDGLGRMFINKYDNLDDFGKKSIKFQSGDILLSWNGIEVNDKNIQQVLSEYQKTVRISDMLNVKVQRRNNNSGRLEEIALDTKVTTIPVLKKDVFSFVLDPSEEQLKLRQIWLGVNENK